MENLIKLLGGGWIFQTNAKNPTDALPEPLTASKYCKENFLASFEVLQWTRLPRGHPSKYRPRPVLLHPIFFIVNIINRRALPNRRVYLRDYLSTESDLPTLLVLSTKEEKLIEKHSTNRAPFRRSLFLRARAWRLKFSCPPTPEKSASSEGKSPRIDTFAVNIPGRTRILSRGTD